MGDTRKTIRYFIKYLKSYWKGITIVVILSLVSSGAQVLAPTFLGQAVTDLTNYLSDLKKETVSLNTFYGALGSMLVFYVLSQVAIFIAWMVMSKFNADSTNDMRENLFSKFQRMMIRYFDTHQDGKLLSLFTSDLDNIFNAMNNAIFEIISQGIMFIGTIIVMFTVNAQLAWTTIASTPLILIVAVLIMKKARIYLDKQQDEIGDLNGYITEQINGEKVIITNNLRQESVAGFKTYNNRVRKAMFKGQFYSGMLFPLMNGLNLLNLAIVIAMGAWMIISGQVSQAIGLGLIVTFVEYSQNYFQPLTQITSIYSMIQLALTGARRLATVEEQKDENAVPNGKILHGVQEGVKLENVHFGYDQNKEILHGVNIAVAKGQSVALVGPTGSGKTTIMNLLNRFYDVNSGKVTFDNIDVRDIQLKSLRDNVGIVLQDSVLFSGTIADNIRYGKPNATMDEVISAAKQANIHDFIESLPDGYNTRVNDASSVFSTGQKQLVSIARTILTNPDFLILDEATSNVDTVTEEKIQQAMDAVIAGRTSFVIAHRLKTILNSNKIVVLKDGNVIEEGSHEKLLADKGFYYKLYTDQTAFN
ncbi:ABC transporter ATP-binding protein [Lactobacillus kefiranofaciens]|uniref:ATP-binding cassette, subfamily B, multidrug efflux pump n=1 Tax=Lactobacillus kefiranofaciens TaxID=267818 RepID=A0ABY0MAB1_9LACO|nr:ABC transporter ATP-binding protein [Lactobacillus kefiranofaciens]KRM22791.1 ABC transporter ATP-binding and permease [Lactobacillus kefiranofaciens subsp. kefiranofaciens DSM 5016 = JCM 6985]MCJ2171814.1 ABC transporter ATP-binding protein/permease [Lactobacillus kefiranofaciens]QFQ68271.1 ABC transporter ATP-binding protein [Lactobacillus kefiranofaciens subsp. kefiranofaciens]QNT43734.1 ABC transporter ATP-binding protein [Lactobacillus kefiranofaciens]URW70584.1 ABC transporter ATP-bin